MPPATQLPSSSSIQVRLNGELQGSPFTVGKSQSLPMSYPGVNSGAVKILSTNNVPVVSSERVIYKLNNVPISFSEMMALPNGQLDSTYWLPWYNNVDLDTQLRFGNVSSSPATVHVWIGGQEKTSGCTSTPSNIPYPYVLASGASLRVSCPGVNTGPVQIISNRNIVAAERVIYNVNGFTDQLLGDDGVAGWTVGQQLLAALVQQCGSGYPTADWECEQFTSHGACVDWGTGEDERLYFHTFEHSVSVCAGFRREPAGELPGREQWTGPDHQ